MIAHDNRYRTLPKVELHCHLEGTVRLATVVDLARTNRVTMPVGHPSELYRYRDLTQFLDLFWLVQEAICSPDDWLRVAYESIIDGAAHGLVHRETFVTPARHLSSGQSLADILAALDEGFDLAESTTGVSCRIIYDFDRAFGPRAALEQAEMLAELRRLGAPGASRVVGVGMDSTEQGVDPMSFAAAYRVAAAAGLRRTAHQGENSGADAIAVAIDGLGCERIDHGITIFQDPELVARFAAERIPLTVCPSANVRINPDVCNSLADHVFPKMRAAGLLATLNTDDPSLVGLDLTQEYELVSDAYGYGWSDMAQIALDGVEASWLDESEKRAIRQRIGAAVSV